MSQSTESAKVPAHTEAERTRIIEVTDNLLEKNEERAQALRARFRAAGLLVLNVVSSPGSGKTALIQRTIADLAGKGIRVGVIVGDLETDNDARRLRDSGGPVVQITTCGYCHLEAGMVARAADEIDLAALDILVIENVGNLVCPASFDLGEDLRVTLLSVTEGEDKPLKYPTIFRGADAVVVNKMDIAGAVDFDARAARDNIRQVAPRAPLFEVSARTGSGTESWYAWLSERLAAKRS
jgi:hydrogenase nickel incorporation protein HypB